MFSSKELEVRKVKIKLLILGVAMVSDSKLCLYKWSFRAHGCIEDRWSFSAHRGQM